MKTNVERKQDTVITESTTLKDCILEISQIMDNPVNERRDYVLINGKKYLLIKTRVAQFRKHFGLEYGISTQIINDNEIKVVVRAEITDLDSFVIASGIAEEFRSPNPKKVNHVSAIENAETSAIGRALSNFGLSGGEYPSADEMIAVERQREVAAEIKEERERKLFDERVKKWIKFFKKGKVQGNDFTINSIDEVMKGANYLDLVKNKHFSEHQPELLEVITNAKQKALDIMKTKKQTRHDMAFKKENEYKSSVNEYSDIIKG